MFCRTSLHKMTQTFIRMSPQNDLKLSEIRQYEDASSVAYAHMDAFIHFQDWQEYQSREIWVRGCVCKSNRSLGYFKNVPVDGNCRKLIECSVL